MKLLALGVLGVAIAMTISGVTVGGRPAIERVVPTRELLDSRMQDSLRGFEPNIGQFPPDIAFLLTERGRSIALTREGTPVVMIADHSRPVSWRFDASRPNPAMQGLEPGDGVLHYL